MESGAAAMTRHYTGVCSHAHVDVSSQQWVCRSGSNEDQVIC